MIRVDTDSGMRDAEDKDIFDGNILYVYSIFGVSKCVCSVKSDMVTCSSEKLCFIIEKVNDEWLMTGALDLDSAEKCRW